MDECSGVFKTGSRHWRNTAATYDNEKHQVVINLQLFERVKQYPPRGSEYMSQYNMGDCHDSVAIYIHPRSNKKECHGV